MQHMNERTIEGTIERRRRKGKERAKSEQRQ